MYAFEQSYTCPLAEHLAERLQLNKDGSLLALGGSCQFGLAVAQATEFNTYLFADADVSQADADNADNDAVFTCETDIYKPDQLVPLGKFDAVILKEYIERMEEDADGAETDLGELLAALWKIMKLNGRAVLLTRFDPTFPLPKELRENWQNSMPSEADIVAVATENDFECQIETLRYKTSCAKDAYLQTLARLPVVGGLDNNAATEYLAVFPETIEFEDVFTVITLTKVIA